MHNTDLYFQMQKLSEIRICLREKNSPSEQQNSSAFKISAYVLKNALLKKYILINLICILSKNLKRSIVCVGRPDLD